ncbi:MAG: Alpha/beta hydrolase family protein [Actinoallomurus sp.]|nr:Alpha/beta hydrolase family protein [Actinoallomurus sp.]
MVSLVGFSSRYKIARLITAAAVAAVLGPLCPSARADAGSGGSSSPEPGSPAYLARDAQNILDAYGRQTQQQLTPSYITAMPTTTGFQYAADLQSQAAEPTRPALDPGEAVPGWNAGNPYRATWNGSRGHITPVTYTNRYGALIHGDVFTPPAHARDPYTGRALHGPYPGVVITPGSVQGSERMYWWLAEDLAERGYVVMTYDVQGQGRSETFGHQGPITDLPYCDLAAPPAGGEQSPCPGVPFQQTSNFVFGTEDAISFFLSTPAKPYRNPGAGSATVDHYNPQSQRFDHSPDPQTVTPGRTTRLAIIGHSLGALSVSYVQAVDKRVETIVALDKLSTTTSISGSPGFSAQGPLKPVVPGLGVQSEYGFTVAPYFANSGLFNGTAVNSPQQAPDPRREEKTGFDGWKQAGVDTMVIVPRASTHLEYTDIPYVLPASRYGQDVASHYTQAWLDKYLKHDPAAADALLATSFRYLEPVGGGKWSPVTLRRAQHLSFYFCSGYDFHTAKGTRLRNDDIAHVGCR